MTPKASTPSAFHLVLLDTNIWVHKSKLLRSSLGASLVYSVRQSGRRILFPEVVELEVTRNAEILAGELIGRATSALHDLRLLLGRHLPVDLPQPAVASKDVGDRLKELESILDRRPFSLAEARAALQKVVDKRPPSVSGQQYKDCAIWESALEAANQCAVCIVTGDKGFFDNRDEKAGLWPSLQHEASSRPHPISLFYGLKPYLDEHGLHAPPLSQESLLALVEKAVRAEVAWRFSGQGLELREMRACSATALLIGVPGIVVYAFSTEFRAVLEDPDGRRPYKGTIKTQGEITCNLEKNSIADVAFGPFGFYDQKGEPMGGSENVDNPGAGAFEVRHPLGEP